jgi:hypothetical protein
MMRRHWSWAAALGCVMLGCQSSQQGPHAPLLSSKQSVAGVPAKSSAPVQVAEAEPKAPELSSEALATLPTGGEPAASIGLPTGSVRPSDTGPVAPPRDNPFRTANRRRGGPTEATPAVRSSAPRPTDGPDLGSGGTATGHFGHADDYSWLQGIFEKHYRGHCYLRFCDHATTDTHGGKVCLVDDPSLTQFKDGDIVYVEGKIDTEPDTQRHAGWQHYPKYHVKAAKLIGHKD